MKWSDAFIAMWYRQVKLFWRAKPRVIGTIIHPLFWLVFFGLGFSATFRGKPSVFFGHNYIEFLLPGIAMMSVFTGAFMSGVSVIWDKEFGYLKVVLVAPSSRKASLLGRIVGDSTIIVFQSVILLLFGYLLAPSMKLVNIPLFAIVAFLVAMTFSGMGVLLATKMKTVEGFQLIVNVIMLPLIFLSGIFYPISTAPIWLKIMMSINPLTYGVDAARILLIGVGHFEIIFDIMLLLVLSIILLAISVCKFEKITIG